MESNSRYEDSVGLEVIYHHFLKESQAFALIEYLFFNKDVSNEYICRKFDLSYQSFYRLIRNELIRSFKPNTM